MQTTVEFDPITFAPVATQWSNLIFKLYFDDLTLGAPTESPPGTTSNFISFLYGTDTIGGLTVTSTGGVTNTTFDNYFGSGATFRIQSISADEPETIGTIRAKINLDLIDHTDMHGRAVRALHHKVVRLATPPSDTNPPQSEFQINLVNGATPSIPRLFMRYGFELPADLDTILASPESAGEHWASIGPEVKRYIGTNTAYRFVLQVNKRDSDGLLRWRAQGDVYTIPGGSISSVWGPYYVEPEVFPVRLGEPGIAELYIQEPLGGEADETTGITWCRIVYADDSYIMCAQHGGKQMIDTSFYRTLFFGNAYSGADVPGYAIKVWEPEVQDNFPYNPRLLAAEGSLSTPVILPERAFPGAEGWGARSVGGRGGRVMIVSNLNDSGAGSFREALLTTEPRTIVFSVGGTITLLSDITISGASMSYLTVAGQTAPGGGIQTKGATIEIKSGVHDVVLRYWRHRRGWENYADPDTNNFGPGLTVYSYDSPVYNVIIDHCSFGWAQDDTGLWNMVNNVTIQWCIFAEAKNTLTVGDPPKGVNGKGLMMGTEPTEGANMYNISCHHNLLISNYQRNPQIACDGPVEFVNNLVYNYAYFGMHVQNRGSGTRINIIGNYYVAGPDTYGPRYAITVDEAGGSAYEQLNDMMYVSDNITPQRTSSAQPEWDAVGYCGSVGVYCGEPATTDFQTGNPWNTSAWPITISAAADVPALVLAGVGAILPSRDSNDARLVTEYNSGTGSIHTYNDWPTLVSGTSPTDADADGMADSWETAEGVSNPNTVAANGYTNLENYINSLV